MLTSFAQKLPEWQDTEIVEVNREDPHASRFSFDFREKALAGDMRASSNYLSLNGIWKFQWSPNPELRPADFYIQGYDDSGWNDLEKSKLVFLNVDWKQMGVGGDNSWGARTHSEYTIRAEPIAYSFVISPL